MDSPRQTIEFLHRGSIVQLENPDPTRTVLQYLREDCYLTGTKEGCAEGDCGACTVVLIRLEDTNLRYQAVNACIQFLPTLDGCALITVEDLKSPDGVLHPVQQHLVDAHGSQCGFCTPGFVMSAFARYHSTQDHNSIEDTLAGNLCRCTGYGPILQAVKKALASRRLDEFSRADEETKRQLQRLQNNDLIALNNRDKQYFAPATEEQLRDVLSTFPDAILLAGGTDVGLWVTKQHRRLQCLVFLGRIESLQRIEQDDDGLYIGAGVSYESLRRQLAGYSADLDELIRRIGSVQIRNVGTVGGNIANGSPIGDMPPALMVLSARLHLDGPNGKRNLALEDYFLDYGKQDRLPGEYVAAIEVPKLQADCHYRVYKISKRFDQDISAVCAAFFVRLQDHRVLDIRIAFGGMAAIPKRAHHVEGYLRDKAWKEENIHAAIEKLVQDFRPIDDMRASAAYRMKVAGNLLLKCFYELSAAGTVTERQRLPLLGTAPV